MRTNYGRALWLMAGLAAITSCKKDDHPFIEPPIIPDQNKSVFIGDVAGKMFAVNALTGNDLWSYATGPVIVPGNQNYNIKDIHVDLVEDPGIYSSVAISGTNVIFNNGIPTLFNMNPSTGTLNWKVNTGYYLSYGDCSPIIHDNIIYIGIAQRLQGYRLSDGTRVLDVSLENSVNSVNYIDNKLIAGTCYGHVYAIDPVTGNQIWHYQSGTDCYHSNPAIGNNAAYFVSWFGQIEAINLGSGTALWSTRVSNIEDAAVTYNNGNIYISSSDDNKIVALDASTGAIKTIFTTTDAVEFPYRSGVAVDNGVLYAASYEGKVYAFDIATAVQKWSADLLAGQITGSPVVANGVLYIGADDVLYALDITNGSVKWQKNLGNFLYASPVVLTEKGKVYRAPNTGSVY